MKLMRRSTEDNETGRGERRNGACDQANIT